MPQHLFCACGRNILAHNDDETSQRFRNTLSIRTSRRDSFRQNARDGGDVRERPGHSASARERRERDWPRCLIETGGAIQARVQSLRGRLWIRDESSVRRRFVRPRDRDGRAAPHASTTDGRGRRNPSRVEAARVPLHVGAGVRAAVHGDRARPHTLQGPRLSCFCVTQFRKKSIVRRRRVRTLVPSRFRHQRAIGT